MESWLLSAVHTLGKGKNLYFFLTIGAPLIGLDTVIEAVY